MAHRIRIGKQMELSAAAGSIIQTDGSNEQEYLALGTAGQILVVNAGATALEYQAAPLGTTNLGTASIGATTLDVTSSNGTDVTIPAVTTTTAGLATAELFNDVADLTTLTGVASNATDLGTFTGSIITDASDMKTALQEIETYVENIPDAENHFVADITARDALTVQTADQAWVADASADGTVGSGGALYAWSGAAWVKMSEFESMDLTNSFTLAADTGTAETVNGGDTITIAGGTGIASVVSATDTVTLNLSEVVDAFDPADAATTVTLSATPVTTPKIYRNGLLQEAGADYTIAGTTVTVTTAFGGSTGGATEFERVTAVYFS